MWLQTVLAIVAIAILFFASDGNPTHTFAKLRALFGNEPDFEPDSAFQVASMIGDHLMFAGGHLLSLPTFEVVLPREEWSYLQNSTARQEWLRAVTKEANSIGSDKSARSFRPWKGIQVGEISVVLVAGANTRVTPIRHDDMRTAPLDFPVARPMPTPMPTHDEIPPTDVPHFSRSMSPLDSMAPTDPLDVVIDVIWKERPFASYAGCTGQTLRLGRAVASDIRLPPMATVSSRNHAALQVLDGGSISYQDSTSGGTWLVGPGGARRMTRPGEVFAKGTRLRLGDAESELEIEVR